MERKFIELKNKLNNCTKLLITLSKPDGDSIGSAIALYKLLKDDRNNIDVVSSFFIPTYLMKFPDAKVINIQDVGKIDFNNYDAVIVVDSSNAERVIEFSNYPDGWNFPDNVFIISFDHNASHNINFADIDIFEPLVSSTCELVYDFANYAGLNIDNDVATLLYSGIFTDSGGFTYSNTTSKSLHIAGELMNHGADIGILDKILNEPKQFDSLILLSKILQDLTIIKEENFAYTLTIIDREIVKNISDEVLSQVIYMLKDDPAFIQKVKGTDFGILIYPGSNCTNVSFRATNNKFNLSKICIKFGGGGHPLACAFHSVKRYDEILSDLNNEIKQLK
ncbi:MAG: DHH family phosphoesterase [bacterium]